MTELFTYAGTEIDQRFLNIEKSVEEFHQLVRNKVKKHKQKIMVLRQEQQQQNEMTQKVINFKLEIEDCLDRIK